MGNAINFESRTTYIAAVQNRLVFFCAMAFLVLSAGCGESEDATLASKKLPEQQASKAWQEVVLQLDPKAIASESGLSFTY